MRIAVDGGLCTGHGRCYSVAPDLLESDDEGFVTIRGSSIDVPPGQESAAKDAAAWCPEGAITISE